MSDAWEDPEVQAWAKAVREDLIPKLESSGAAVSLVPNGDTDVKFAVELGFSIMLDKPIYAVVEPGTPVPPKLVLVADKIIEADLHTEAGREALQRQLMAFLDEEGSG